MCCHYKKYLPAAVRDFASVLVLFKWEDTLPLVELIIAAEQQLGIEKTLGTVLKNGVVGLFGKEPEKHKKSILKMAKTINEKNWLQEEFEQSTFFYIQGLFEEEVNLSIEAYQKAVQIKPDYHNALNNLGIAYSDKGEFDNAISAYSCLLYTSPSPRDRG